MTRRPATATLIVSLLVACLAVPATATPASSPPAGLRVYMDCAAECHLDYLRQELPELQYVRDRHDAQVHVLVTSRSTGNGGVEYRLEFIGRGRHAGRSHVLTYVASPVATTAERREGIRDSLIDGVARFGPSSAPAARSGGRIPVSVIDSPGVVVPDRATTEPGAQAAGPGEDPWDAWTFRIGANGSLNSQSSTSYYTLNGFLGADRTTRDWKIRVGASGDYSESRFEFSDDETFRSVTRDFSATAVVVRSVGGHVGLGLGASAVSSTFLNQDLALRIAPAIEYNFFPYSDSSSRQFTVSYAAGLTRFQYAEETIFGVLEETRTDSTLTLNLDLVRPWGSGHLAVEASHYLRDFDRNSVVAYGSVAFRLVRGLSLVVSGNGASVRNQIYLPAGGATQEEILLQLRELETSFRFSASVGFTYTFGSIYDDVVNPRFAGASGGFVRAF